MMTLTRLMWAHAPQPAQPGAPSFRHGLQGAIGRLERQAIAQQAPVIFRVRRGRVRAILEVVPEYLVWPGQVEIDGLDPSGLLLLADGGMSPQAWPAAPAHLRQPQRARVVLGAHIR